MALTRAGFQQAAGTHSILAGWAFLAFALLGPVAFAAAFLGVGSAFRRSSGGSRRAP